MKKKLKDFEKRLKKLKGANVIVFDPFVPKLSDVKTLREFLINLEAIVICTAHDEIKNIDYNLFKNKSLKVIIDGRNCLDKKKIKGNNLIYIFIWYRIIMIIF